MVRRIIRWFKSLKYSKEELERINKTNMLNAQICLSEKHLCDKQCYRCKYQQIKL